MTDSKLVTSHHELQHDWFTLPVDSISRPQHATSNTREVRGQNPTVHVELVQRGQVIPLHSTFVAS